VFSPETVQVPAVTEQSWADASKAINAVNLQPVQKKVNNAAAEGTVVSQDPQPYTPVAPGSQVTLSVSTGKVKLPDVSSDHPLLSDARDTLNAAGYIHIDSSKTVDTDKKALNGHVASQDPSPNHPYPLDTTITLTVFKYVATSGTVPDVKTGNPTFDDAKKTLNAAGFKNVVQDPTPTPTDDPALDGRVVDQNPPGGTANVPFTTQITLIVYKLGGDSPGTGDSPPPGGGGTS
jgi:serine/threonine-protein kinase